MANKIINNKLVNTSIGDFLQAHPVLKVRTISSSINHAYHGKNNNVCTEFSLPMVDEVGFLGFVRSVRRTTDEVPSEVIEAVRHFENGNYHLISDLVGTVYHWQNPNSSVLRRYLPSIHKSLSLSLDEMDEDTKIRSEIWEDVEFEYLGNENYRKKLRVKSLPEHEYPQSFKLKVGDIIFHKEHTIFGAKYDTLKKA